MPGSETRRSLRIFQGLAAVGIVLLVAGVAVASTTLFSQSVPASILFGPKKVVSTNCGGAVLAPVGTGGSTSNVWQTYGCTQSSPAIFLSNPGVAHASFTTTSGVTDLWLVPTYSTLVGGCSDSGPAGSNLTNVPSVSVNGFNQGTPMYYCLDSPGGLTIVGFTISWSQ